MLFRTCVGNFGKFFTKLRGINISKTATMNKKELFSNTPIFTAIILLLILLISSAIPAQTGGENPEAYTPVNWVHFNNTIIHRRPVTNPTSIYAADLDLDGDMDVISSSRGDDKIAWYRNEGNGFFNNQQVISDVANEAKKVFAADLDNDNDPEILAAYEDKVVYFRNLGNGNFGPQQVITIYAATATDIFAADLDGDGDTDVLSASSLDNKIAWYQNNGNGYFNQQQFIITTNAMGAMSVYADDMDNDGDNDVIQCSNNDQTISWFINDGTGDFGSERYLSSAVNGPRSGKAYDLDNDNDKDILAVSYIGNKIIWYKNNGSGIFGLEQFIATIDRPTDCACFGP